VARPYKRGMKTILIAAAVLALAPATASAQSARFVGYVEGKQVTTWEIPRHQHGVRDCKGAAFLAERGSETVRFRTRPARIRADRIGGYPALKYGTWSRFAAGKPHLAATGTVTRTHDAVRDYEPGPCGAPPQPAPPVYDCGKRRYAPEVRLQWRGHTAFVAAAQPDLAFLSCPLRAATGIIEGDFTEIGERYPVRELFDRRQGLVVVLGKRTYSEQLDFGGVTTTTITWKLRLRRR